MRSFSPTRSLGLSLVELLVGIFVFATLTTSIAGLAIFGTRTAVVNEQRVVAQAIAREEAEKIRLMSYGDVGYGDGAPDGVLPHQKIVLRNNNQQYTVSFNIELKNDPANDDKIPPSFPLTEENADYKQVIIKAITPSGAVLNGAMAEVSVGLVVTGAAENCRACLSSAECVSSNCTQDTDCAGGNTCQGGLCEPPATQPSPVVCVADTDCTAGYVCVSNLCTSNHSCGTDTDCPNGFTCTFNTCSASKTPSAENVCGMAVIQAAGGNNAAVCCDGSCRVPIEENQCPEGYKVDFDGCGCIPIPSPSPSDTPTPSPTASPSESPPPPCTSSNQCPAGYGCTNNTCACENPPCDTTVPTSCVDSGSCPAGYNCNLASGECDTQTNCLSSNDCPVGYACTDSSCAQTPDCSSDLSCASGFYCGADGACVPLYPNGPDEQIANNGQCSDDNDCAYGCNFDEDTCNSDSVSGGSVSVGLGYGNACPAPILGPCVGGVGRITITWEKNALYCTPVIKIEACDDGGSGRAYCDLNSNSSTNCGMPNANNSGSEAELNQCTDPGWDASEGYCTTDDDCEIGMACKAKKCVATCPAGCLENEGCEQGVCKPRVCNVNKGNAIDKDGRRYCDVFMCASVGGKCVTGCTSDTQCALGEICQQGICRSNGRNDCSDCGLDQYGSPMRISCCYQYDEGRVGSGFDRPCRRTGEECQSNNGHLGECVLSPRTKNGCRYYTCSSVKELFPYRVAWVVDNSIWMGGNFWGPYLTYQPDQLCAIPPDGEAAFIKDIINSLAQLMKRIISFMQAKVAWAADCVRAQIAGPQVHFQFTDQWLKKSSVSSATPASTVSGVVSKICSQYSGYVNFQGMVSYLDFSGVFIVRDSSQQDPLGRPLYAFKLAPMTDCQGHEITVSADQYSPYGVNLRNCVMVNNQLVPQTMTDVLGNEAQLSYYAMAESERKMLHDYFTKIGWPQQYNKLMLLLQEHKRHAESIPALFLAKKAEIEKCLAKPPLTYRSRIDPIPGRTNYYEDIASALNTCFKLVIDQVKADDIADYGSSGVSYVETLGEPDPERDGLGWFGVKFSSARASQGPKGDIWCQACDPFKLNPDCSSRNYPVPDIP